MEGMNYICNFPRHSIAAKVDIRSAFKETKSQVKFVGRKSSQLLLTLPGWANRIRDS